jgi:hypothetical protein
VAQLVYISSIVRLAWKQLQSKDNKPTLKDKYNSQVILCGIESQCPVMQSMVFIVQNRLLWDSVKSEKSVTQICSPRWVHRIQNQYKDVAHTFSYINDVDYEIECCSV